MATLPNENAVLTALERRWEAPAWAFFRKVANKTGYAASRTADAIAMGLWPSRGLEVIGFEVKVNRGDWLKELGDPAKADEIGKYCDRWYLALGNKSIAKADEVPIAWGILAPRGDSMVTVREPKVLKAKKLDRGFVAALVRRAHERMSQGVAPEDLQAKLAEARAAAEKGLALAKKYEIENLRRENDRLAAECKKLQEAVGSELAILSCDHIRSLRELHRLLSTGWNSFDSIIERTIRSIKGSSTALDAEVQRLEEAREAVKLMSSTADLKRE